MAIVKEYVESEKESRLTCLLQERHSEFIDLMYKDFGLMQRPVNIPIVFQPLNGYSGILHGEGGRYNIIKIDENLKEGSSEEENLGVELIIPHETAHYLHALRQPEFYADCFEQLSKRENFYLEKIAELATLVFLNKSGRGAEKYRSLNMRLEGNPQHNGKPYWGDSPGSVIVTWVSNKDNLKLARKRLKKMASLSHFEFDSMHDLERLYKIEIFGV